ncbi:thioredoxin domain-containing protein [Streptomyces sp. PSAA01]|uniref:thioredoxin domain-containing protein n=1 Tax=Streptomyces sp. PSAA01 TaxID=2912762 RepID=UPI001F2A9FBC|nr:thioredoxin domain-containing protein [Streptomyces sp. PSAA01]MCG0290943.1 DsbA family protein [Streptomyces sp. PSAA01]
MWPGQQPPGGEQNPQQNPYQQPEHPQPGHPPPPAQPPGFPPAPPPPGPGGGPWGGAPAPADPQRKAGLTAVVAVTVAAAVVAGVLLITDDDKGSRGGSSDDVVQGPPGVPGPDGSGGSQGPGNLVAPAHSSGPGGTTVVIGEADAGHTLDVYEDLRCPPCASFDQAVGPTIAKDIKAGTYKVSFHFAAILDKSMGGNGSANALSALGAALDVSTDTFLDYKAALMSPKNHPEESEDSYADDNQLLTVSQEVYALKTNASFREALREGTYDPWAKKMIADFDASGVNGTPTVKLDGSQLTGSGGSTPLTATEFTEAVNKQLKGG